MKPFVSQQMEPSDVVTIPYLQTAYGGQQLFESFRTVYGAEQLTERAVFWLQETRRGLLLRHVTERHHRSPVTDKVIGFVSDVVGARVAIGNFAAGAICTTVRWEIYADFDLSHLLASGRFDVGDLLPPANRLTVDALRSSGARGDWDFDALLATHICPFCRRVRGQHSILYLPYFPCEECRRVPTIDHAEQVIALLLRKFALRSVLTIQALHAKGSELGLHDFIDPQANAVIAWQVTNMTCLSSIRDKATARLMQELFFRSLFHLMRTGVRSDLLEYCEREGGVDSEITFAAIGQMGAFFAGVIPRQDILPFADSLIKNALPILLSQLIVNVAKRISPYPFAEVIHE